MYDVVHRCIKKDTRMIKKKHRYAGETPYGMRYPGNVFAGSLFACSSVIWMTQKDLTVYQRSVYTFLLYVFKDVFLQKNA
jgi:hypothetical protein